jgi:hypothetical protein
MPQGSSLDMPQGISGVSKGRASTALAVERAVESSIGHSDVRLSNTDEYEDDVVGLGEEEVDPVDPVDPVESPPVFDLTSKGSSLALSPAEKRRKEEEGEREHKRLIIIEKDRQIHKLKQRLKKKKPADGRFRNGTKRKHRNNKKGIPSNNKKLPAEFVSQMEQHDNLEFGSLVEFHDELVRRFEAATFETGKRKELGSYSKLTLGYTTSRGKERVTSWALALKRNFNLWGPLRALGLRLGVRFTSIDIVKNCPRAIHTDNGNVGISKVVTFGNFDEAGGKFEVWPDRLRAAGKPDETTLGSKVVDPHYIRSSGQGFEFDGKCWHSACERVPAAGSSVVALPNRYSVVYYSKERHLHKLDDNESSPPSVAYIVAQMGRDYSFSQVFFGANGQWRKRHEKQKKREQGSAKPHKKRKNRLGISGSDRKFDADRYKEPEVIQVLEVNGIWRDIELYRHKESNQVVLHFGGTEYEGLDEVYTVDASSSVLRDSDGEVIKSRPVEAKKGVEGDYEHIVVDREHAEEDEYEDVVVDRGHEGGDVSAPAHRQVAEAEPSACSHTNSSHTNSSHTYIPGLLFPPLKQEVHKETEEADRPGQRLPRREEDSQPAAKD